MTVKQLMGQMQEVFLEETEKLGRCSGFCRRRSPITPQAWVQGLVFGWLADPQASVSALARSMALAGAVVTPQAVQQRFGQAGIQLLAQVLERLAAYVLRQGMIESSADSETRANEATSWVSDLAPKRAWRRLRWLEAFPRIWIRDGTVISLPRELRHKWRGTGGFAGPSAGLKISVQWEWHSGLLLPLRLSHAAEHDFTLAQAQDRTAHEQGHCVQEGEMHLFDLGYFKLKWLKELAAQNAFFCCRYKSGTVVRTQDATIGSAGLAVGSAIGTDVVQRTAQLTDWLNALPATQCRLEMVIGLGQKSPLQCRLLAKRVPPEVKAELQAQLQAKCERKGQALSQERLDLCGWTVLVTNAPADKLCFEQAFELYRLRWQIERLFRLWKETLQVDKWRVQRADRIECEIYAKLIGALLTQQITAYAAWSDPARSLVKCARTVAQHALGLLLNLNCSTALQHQLRAIQTACSKAARIESRCKKPSTLQRLRNAQRTLA